MTRKLLILQYILSQSAFLDDDLLEVKRRILYHHDCDEVDCLEYIIAKTRHDLFAQTARDIMHIYKISADDLQELAESRGEQ